MFGTFLDHSDPGLPFKSCLSRKKCNGNLGHDSICLKIAAALSFLLIYILDELSNCLCYSMTKHIFTKYSAFKQTQDYVQKIVFTS